MHQLQNVSLKELQQARKKDPRVHFGLYTSKMPCKVVKVYDADTITLAFRVPVPQPPPKHLIVYRSCRISGIDAPELRTSDPEEREAAQQGADQLRNLIIDEIMYMDSVGPDKYGRPLVDLYASPFSSARLQRKLGRQCISEWIFENLPKIVRYDGKRKPTFKERE